MQMYPAIGAYIQAFGPDWRVARRPHFYIQQIAAAPSRAQRTSIAADFQLEAALLLADREQLFNGIHP